MRHSFVFQLRPLEDVTPFAIFAILGAAALESARAGSRSTACETNSSNRSRRRHYRGDLLMGGLDNVTTR